LQQTLFPQRDILGKGQDDGRVKPTLKKVDLKADKSL
jgi:hypothetical protein